MPVLIESQAEPIVGYRLIERIGGGGFGDVWKAEAPGGLLKAIKVIHGDLRNADLDGARHAEQELKALKRVQAIRHPYLLSLERYDIIEGRLLIVMELADCNLWDRFRECRANRLPGIPRDELLGYLEESAEVLDLMNNKFALQHLDIKPQNLFLVHNHVKVADFGLVKDLEGVRAAITGGVTPVYAAPETFEGVATRFCDQYSLAIVYQELLTGVRPYNGANSQQLLMQHLQGVPNLAPLPAADRPTVARALSKKPDERFPTCLEFVRSLYQAGGDKIGGAMPGAPSPVMLGRSETAADIFSTVGALGRTGAAPFPAAEAPPETPRTELRFKRDDQSASPSSVELQAPIREAPREETGSGVLVPAVIIGIGHTGVEVVRNFRRQVVDRYGAFDRLAHLRLICIDTDSEALQAATAATAGVPLGAGEIIPMRLNRASHYLKPRRNGRSLIEGWLDPQMLYRIPRNPQSLGLRCFGRLAFCDHYRTFATKLREELEICSKSDAIALAERHTKLGLRSNRPRVYVVVGLGGGTGGGMFIDTAYTARHKLKQLGYLDPEIIGVFLVPAVDPKTAKQQAIGNAYASLRELHHFSLPETLFAASHDDRDGNMLDSGAPFGRFFLLTQDIPAKAAEATGVDSAPMRAAEFLRRDLLGPLGRITDESRAEFNEQKQTKPIVASVINQASFVWPKQMILSQASRWVGEALVSRWLKVDLTAIQEPVRNWLNERWNTEQFDSDSLIARLQKACEKKVDQQLETLFAAEAQPFVPRGWFARDPDTTKLWQTVKRLVQLVGMPDERAMQRQVGQIELILNEAADDLLRDVGARLTRLPRTLLEHPDYRLAGGEEAIAQLTLKLSQQIEHYEPLVEEMALKAIDAYYVVQSFLMDEPGRHKPSPAEIAEGLRGFPKWRYQSLVLRQICRAYIALRGQLLDLAREFKFCRQRLDDLLLRFRLLPADAIARPESALFPAGCTSTQEAVDALCKSIQPDEMRALDKAMQKHVEQTYEALFSVCMSSINMLGNLQGIVEEQTRSFLAGRLGDSNIGEMFFSRFADGDAAIRAIKQIHDQAVPSQKTSRPVTQEICVLMVPEGEKQKPFQQVACQAIPGKAIDFVTSSEEILVYREWPRFPLTSLPQLSPQAEDAYNQMQNAGPGMTHTRNDVGKWFDIDG